MSNDKPFQPEFGPNSAVLNAPTMPPEMRAKFEEIGKILPRAEWLGWVWFFAFIGVVVLIGGWFFTTGRKLLQESPWWAGAFTGAVAALAGVMLWQITRRSFARWELTGGQTRVLTAPLWVRVLFSAAEILWPTWCAVYFVTIVANLNFDGDLWSVSIVAAAIVILLGFFMRWVGEKRGWAMRSPA